MGKFYIRHVKLHVVIPRDAGICELASLDRDSEANLRNEKRCCGNITFVRIHMPALWATLTNGCTLCYVNLLVLDGCVVAMLTSLIEAAVGLPITKPPLLQKFGHDSYAIFILI